MIPADSGAWTPLRAEFLQIPHFLAIVAMDGKQVPSLLQQLDRYVSTSFAIGGMPDSNTFIVT